MIKAKRSSIEKALSNLDKATKSKTNVKVGFFEEQGMHPTAPMTYVELAQYHANGGGGKVPVRDILQATLIDLKMEDLTGIEKIIFDYLSNPVGDLEDALLPYVGESIALKMKSIFGGPLLHPTDSNPDPLIDTGALRDHTAYKIGDSPAKEV